MAENKLAAGGYATPKVIATDALIDAITLHARRLLPPAAAKHMNHWHNLPLLLLDTPDNRPKYSQNSKAPEVSPCMAR